MALEKPPKLNGRSSSPECFELAKRLKRAPRGAQEIAATFPLVQELHESKLRAPDN